jgi:3-oxoacyl-[acyl-carrier protein] reductase
MTLEGKVAIVTGASRGIGRAIALELGRCGATVLVNYHSSSEAAEEVAAQIGGTAVQANVATTEGCDALIAAAEALGSLDILVNNAGITRDTLILRMSDEEWGSVLETNLNATFRLCRSAAEIMLRQRSGAIVNLTSVSGIRGNPGQANYAASKAAIAAMSTSMAKELGRRGIRVNCVAPGFIQTDMVEAMNPKIVDGVRSMIPMRRLGDPAEVARVVRFLCSDEATYVTGQQWVVDGGLS